MPAADVGGVERIILTEDGWHMQYRISALLTGFVVLVSIGCSVTDQKVNRNENETLQPNHSIPSDGALIEFDFYQAVDTDLEHQLNEISPRLGLVPLAKANRLEGFEFRLWTELAARGDPKLLGMSSTGSETNAYYFEMDRNADSIKSRREHLPSPKSGWNRMLLDLRTRLQTPKGLARDPNFDLNRDEPVIVLEVFDKGDYRRVIYGHNSSFPDAKRLIHVCDYLAAEFDVEMGCREDGTN